MSTVLGCKFYKYDEYGGLDIIRLKKIKNQNTTFIMNDEFGRTFKLTSEELSSYTRLNPDGYITFSIVGLEHGINDVIITLHRKKDIQNGDNIPYCTCRQNVFNFFANQTNRDENIMIIGASVSKDTCPPDIDYKMMLACNSVLQIDVINIYLDDTLDDVLKFINTLNYDHVLRELYNKMDREKTIGSCNSLKSLLSYTGFWDDILRAYNIIKVPMSISGNETLSDIERECIEGIIKHQILSHAVTIYDKDIDLDNAKHRHLLLSDSNGIVYVLVYIKGSYINREYDSLSDQSEKQVLLNSIK